MLTTTATTPRRAVETTLLKVLAECRQRTAPAPRLPLRRPTLPAALVRRTERLGEGLGRAGEIARDVLDNEALAIAGMGLMFLAFLLI